MQTNILYVDHNRSRKVQKTLERLGVVTHSSSLGHALHEVIKVNYDYFVVDAGLPDSFGLINHLEHDPDLVRSCRILLFSNDDEEKDWEVDYRVDKGRASSEIPRIFSDAEKALPKPIPLFSRDRSPGTLSGGCAVTSPDPGTLRQGGRGRRSRLRGAVGGEGSPLVGRSGDGVALRAFRGTIAIHKLFAVLAVAIGVWASLVFWGPVSSSLCGSANTHDEEGLVNSGFSAPGGLEEYFRTTRTEEGQLDPLNEDEAPEAGGTEGPGNALMNGLLTEPATGNNEETRKDPASKPSVIQEPAVRAGQDNRPPSVTISGSALLHTGESCTYTAVASDPDGDSILYSWGGPTVSRCWQVPGQYEVSVTVTDSRGLSASASLVVRVIQ